jgi:putative BNR repeat neuraminidase
MNRLLLSVFLGAALSFVSAAAPAHAAPGDDDGHGRGMAVMTPDSASAARTDRRPVAGGLYDPVARQTFISFAGAHEDNYVQAYDHRTGTWSAPVRVGSGDDDSHNYPTMVQARDGHLLVFHNLHNTQLFVARSPYPHSIAGTWTEQVVAEGAGATYPMPFVTDSGAVFVFIRETAHDLDRTQPVDFRPMKYVRSLDGGLTWSNTAQLTGDRYAIAPNGRPDNLNEVYIGQLRYIPGGFLRPDRVLIVYTLAGGGPEGHLHDRYHKNIYYTYFTPGDLHFHAADGRDLGTRIDDAAQEAYLKVADTALMPAPYQRSPDYISLVGEIVPGVPVVLWMQLDGTGLVHDYAGIRRFDGQWRVTEVGTGFRMRDMEQVGPVAWRVYATDDRGAPGIQTYQFIAGLVWHAGPVIPTPKPVQRIEVITDGRDPARILATGASSARDVSVADGDVYVAGFPCGN